MPKEPRRLISRDESFKSFKELDKVIPPDMTHLCLIVDDTESVWPEHRGNLVRVDPFVHFTPAGMPREDAADADLHFLLRFLARVHRLFFAAGEGAAVPAVAAAVSRDVFAGLAVGFSGVFALGSEGESADENCRKFAEMGGRLVRDLATGAPGWAEIDYLLVRLPKRTQKVKEALRRGVRVLREDWLSLSVRYRLALDPRTFQLFGEAGPPSGAQLTAAILAANPPGSCE